MMLNYKKLLNYAMKDRKCEFDSPYSTLNPRTVEQR